MKNVDIIPLACGTASATNFENRSGRCPTAAYEEMAPQSCPMSTASPSPASASAIPSVSSATDAAW